LLCSSAHLVTLTIFKVFYYYYYIIIYLFNYLFLHVTTFALLATK